MNMRRRYNFIPARRDKAITWRKNVPARRDSSSCQPRSRLRNLSRLGGTGWISHVIGRYNIRGKYHSSEISVKHPVPARRDKFPHIIGPLGTDYMRKFVPLCRDRIHPAIFFLLRLHVKKHPGEAGWKLAGDFWNVNMKNNYGGKNIMVHRTILLSQSLHEKSLK